MKLLVMFAIIANMCRTLLTVLFALVRRSVATTIVYDAFDMIEERAKRNALEIFDQAIKNVSPILEVKPRRVGGATYQIPMEVPPYRRFALASRWILQGAMARSGKSFSEKLAGELVGCSQ